MARKSEGLTLRAVSSNADISPAYLQKLESDKVQSPSPHVLQRISEVLRISYERLMERAGYFVPNTSAQRAAGVLDVKLASSSLSDTEERAVAAFIDHLLVQRQR